MKSLYTETARVGNGDTALLAYARGRRWDLSVSDGWLYVRRLHGGWCLSHDRAVAKATDALDREIKLRNNRDS